MTQTVLETMVANVVRAAIRADSANFGLTKTLIAAALAANKIAGIAREDAVDWVAGQAVEGGYKGNTLPAKRSIAKAFIVHGLLKDGSRVAAYAFGGVAHEDIRSECEALAKQATESAIKAAQAASAKANGREKGPKQSEGAAPPAPQGEAPAPAPDQTLGASHPAPRTAVTIQGEVMSLLRELRTLADGGDKAAVTALAAVAAKAGEPAKADAPKRMARPARKAA